jgi:hypothetical protein
VSTVRHSPTQANIKAGLRGTVPTEELSYFNFLSHFNYLSVPVQIITQTALCFISFYVCRFNLEYGVDRTVLYTDSCIFRMASPPLVCHKLRTLLMYGIVGPVIFRTSC